MSAARSTFFDAIASIKAAAAEPILIDVFPPSSHNNRARILRCGLVVSAFSHLESYIEDRFGEVLQLLPSSSISYSAYGEGLKKLFTLHAIIGLTQRASFLNNTDALKLVETNLPLMASYLSTPPSFVNLGFSPKGSNISSGDINELIKAFGVNDVWAKLNTLVNSMGGGRLKLIDDFQNLLRTRNSSAHDSSANVPSVDVITHADTALLVGIGVDLALSHVVACYKKALKVKSAMTAADRLAVAFRFLDEDPSGRWREKSLSLRTLRYHSAITVAQAVSNRPAFVVRDIKLFPIRLI